MYNGEKKIERILQIFVVLSIILVGIFAEGAWAQTGPPSVVNYYPGDTIEHSINVLINTQITVQFNMTMIPASSQFYLEDEYGNDVMGTVQWRNTASTNDTLVFTPQNGLKPANHYYYEGNAQAATGGGAWFNASFITKYSYADATPPTVQTVYPYVDMTGVSTGERILIKFSEAMNPATINSDNITISGLTSSNYDVKYDFGNGDVKIKLKNTHFAAGTLYTVTISTNVRDVRGNPLKTPYSWSFTTTGAPDITPPTVTQTIPTINDTKVSLSPNLYAIFSEEMDGSTLNTTNITLFDNTPPTGFVPINIYDSGNDYVSFGPQSALTYNHNYTATIGTEVKDRAGNHLVLKTWSFTTAINSGIDSDPIINSGLSGDDHIGQRFSDNTTRVDLVLSAWDPVPSSTLTVTASTLGHPPWILTGSGGYSYKSTGDEGLLNGNHTLTFTITDGASNQVTFNRDIYIFSASPILNLPGIGATGVSITPTFTWTYSGSPRPFYYNVAVFDGPNPDTDHMVWMGIMIDKGSDVPVPHSITIPADKQLTPNKSYYWGVRGANSDDNGETFSFDSSMVLRHFTTGGTPPPAAYFIWTFVRSDDIYPPGPTPTGNLLVKVGGVSPADIVQLKVTNPGGFQYIFTEDDISRSEQIGQYYNKNFPSLFPDGTYTFSLTDSAGRTITATQDFTHASVPRVDYNFMVPANNTYVNTTTPTLSWDSVPGGYYYRVFISDWNGNDNPLYASDFIQNTSITVPSGFLLPNTPYKWMVTVNDAPFGNNRSRSNTLQFSTGNGIYTTGTQLEWVHLYNENNYYIGPIKSISANVLGPLPNLVSSFNVSGPGSFSYDFLQTNILYNLAWTHGSTYLYPLQPGAVVGGSYTFSLTTPAGTTNYPKNMTSLLTIPIVDQATMSPVNNAYLTNLTPTFSWNTVGGSYYYRIFIMDWRSHFIIYASTNSTSLSCTIPAGVLKPNRSYMWRVEVYEDSTGAANNRSTSGMNCFTTPKGTRFDFNGDSKADVLWRNVSSGNPISGWTYVWQMHGTTASDGGAPAQVDDSNWQIKGMGDFNNDGSVDIFWQHIPTGWTYIWFMRGGTIQYGGAPGMVGDPNWQIKGIGDFNGDGNDDVLWQNIGTGEPISGWTYIWSMDGSMIKEGEAVRQVDSSWQIKAIGDFNGDGKADILWQHTTTGWIYIWFMDGGTVIDEGAVSQVSDPSFQIKGIGDFNGDGKDDILWYQTTTGWVSIWLMDGKTIVGGGAVKQVGDLNWQIKGVGDYNGDRKADILWRDASSGWILVWIMDGNTILEEGSPGLVGDPNWQIIY